MTVALHPGDLRAAAAERYIEGRRRYYATLSDTDLWLLIVERGLRLARDMPATPFTVFLRMELTRFLLEADYAQYLRLHPITAVRPTVPQPTIPVPRPTIPVVPRPTVTVPTIIPRPAAIIPTVRIIAQPVLPITVPLLPNGQPDIQLETYLQRQYGYYLGLSLERLVEAIMEENLDEDDVLAELLPGPIDPDMLDRDALIERLLRRDRDENLELRPIPTIPQPTVPVPRPTVPPATVTIPTIPRPIVSPATVTIPRPTAPPIPTIKIPANIKPFVPPPPEAQAPRVPSPPRTPSPRGFLTITPPRMLPEVIPQMFTQVEFPLPTFETQIVVPGIPRVLRATVPGTIEAFQTRVLNLPEGRVLNVSNLTPDGKGARLINQPRTDRTNLRGIPVIPIMSNNSQTYIRALEMTYGYNWRIAYPGIARAVQDLQARYPGW